METMQTPWFFKSEEILKKLETSLEGLSEEEASRRLQKFGNNDLRRKSDLSVLKIFFSQFMSPLIFVLLGAAVLTGILEEWLNVGVILGAVIINVLLGFHQEYQAENSLEKLESYIKDRTRIIREGHEQEIESSLIVPGDIVKLNYGSRVPGDTRLISVTNFKVDESILTGESAPEAKKTDVIEESTQVADRTNMAYAGTLVVEGTAVGVIVDTGKKTEIGKIAELVSRTDRALTPIQKGIGELSWYIFLLVIFVIILVLLLGIFRGMPFIEMLVLSAAIAVGAVPEALPIALTVVLSIGAERIALKKGVVRKLAAAETLGSTTLVMTDKTGTLTKAEMQLVGVHTFKDLKKKYSEKAEKLSRLSLEEKKLISLALNNINVAVQNPNEEEKKWTFTGHPFEVNIAKAAIFHGVSIKEILEKKILIYLPFNSSNKFSISQASDRSIIMGAPDILLKKSNASKEDYLEISSWIEEASNNGKRLIALATIDSKKEIDPKSIKDINFEGILSFFDPIREEVPSAVKNIEMHGVKVAIITGDLKGTALSVAKSLGWEISENQVLSGEDIHQMTDEELLEVIPNVKIFARVTPEDKLRIGNLYQKLGEVVAMTGDGVNDAPALKSMNIGISLGTGSDVAKSTADLVLLDDNFNTINMAIDEGRRILLNIKKIFIYLMSNALDQIFVIGGSLIMSIPLPITALQIIWVNLFTGSFPALAFAYDENLDKGMEKVKSNEKILTSEVKILSFGIGTFTSLLLFLLYYLLIKFGVELSVARSVFFVCHSVYILIIAFSFRSLYKPIFSYNPFSNKNLNIAMLFALAILVVTMSIPFVRNLFGIAPMPLQWISFVLFWIVLNVLLVEAAKWMFRRRIKNGGKKFFDTNILLKLKELFNIKTVQ